MPRSREIARTFRRPKPLFGPGATPVEPLGDMTADVQTASYCARVRITPAAEPRKGTAPERVEPTGGDAEQTFKHRARDAGQPADPRSAACGPPATTSWSRPGRSQSSCGPR